MKKIVNSLEIISLYLCFIYLYFSTIDQIRTTLPSSGYRPADGAQLWGSALIAVQDLIRAEDPDFAGLLPRRDKQRRRLWVDPSNAHHYPERGAY